MKTSIAVLLLTMLLAVGASVWRVYGSAGAAVETQTVSLPDINDGQTHFVLVEESLIATGSESTTIQDDDFVYGFGRS
jgi:hypothetical protein